MGKKDGDPPRQRLLDESTRIPPSPKLIKETLREIGAPDPERTAKLLAENGISFVPVETPARTSKKAQPPSPIVVAQQRPSPTPLPTMSPPVERLWSIANVKRYGRDCSYSLAVRWGSGLLGWTIVVVASFLTIHNFDLLGNAPDIRAIFRPSSKQTQQSQSPFRPPPPLVVAAPPATSPDISPIETGSIAPPSPTHPPHVPSPWQTETTIYEAPAQEGAPLASRAAPR